MSEWIEVAKDYFGSLPAKVHLPHSTKSSLATAAALISIAESLEKIVLLKIEE